MATGIIYKRARLPGHHSSFDSLELDFRTFNAGFTLHTREFTLVQLVQLTSNKSWNDKINNLSELKYINI